MPRGARSRSADPERRAEGRSRSSSLLITPGNVNGLLTALLLLECGKAGGSDRLYGRLTATRRQCHDEATWGHRGEERARSRAVERSRPTRRGAPRRGAGDRTTRPGPRKGRERWPDDVGTPWTGRADRPTAATGTR